MRSVYLLFLALLFLGSSCGSGGSATCTDAAAAQCSLWRSCFCPSGDCSHAGVSLAEGTCEDQLTGTCDSQASTLELPSEEVEECVDALDTWTCEDVRSANVQGRETAPDACAYYF